LLHRPGEFSAPGGVLGSGEFGEGGGATLGERLSRIAAADGCEQRLDHGDLLLRLPDARGSGFGGDCAACDLLKLAALEPAASLGAMLIDAASRAAERDAGLIEVHALFDPQAERCERLRTIAGLENHLIEKNAIAAQAAIGAELRGGSAGRFAGHAPGGIRRSAVRQGRRASPWQMRKIDRPPSPSPHVRMQPRQTTLIHLPLIPIRHCGILLGFLVALLAQLCGTLAHSATAPMNVLFIMADDFRPETGTYGSRALTPNLDRLARRALQFNNAFAQQAVCNPSRSSMLTGLRPDTIGLWCNGTHFRELKPDVTTLPLWFKKHGCVSRCVGKIFHNWHTKEHGDPRSWSAPEFLHYANHGEDDAQVKGELPPNLAQTVGGFGYAKNGICECRDVPDEAYYDGRVAAEAARVIGEVKDQRFFLAVGFWKPHAPFNAPKKYWDLYDRAKLPPLDPRRPEGAPEIAFHQSTEVLGPVANQKTPTAEQAAEMRHGYFANISYMDAQLGKVLDALDASGVADRTIVVFVADHGYHIGEHTLWGKTSNFEFDAHVPLFIAMPGMKTAGKQTRSPVELLDLFPTLVDLCQLPKPAGLEGVSLAPVLEDPSALPQPCAFTQHPRPAYYDREPSGQPKAMGYSVRTPRVRYTEWRDWKSGEVIARELYDAASDPNELRNAADAPAVESAQREAAELLKAQFPAIQH